MSEDKYVPQVGDWVTAYQQKVKHRGTSEREMVYGIYAGALSSISAALVLENGEAAEVSDVSLPRYYTHLGQDRDSIEGGSDILFDFCESLADRPQETAEAVGYRDAAATRLALPAEMLEWWEKHRVSMLKRRFGGTAGEVLKASQSIEVIRKNDGEPSTALQERLDAAMYRLGALRTKLCVLYAREIGQAQKCFGINPHDPMEMGR